MDGNWLGSLICPLDRSALAREGEALRCPQCHRAYPVNDGIPNFVAGLPLARASAWETAQEYELGYWDLEPEETGLARETRLQHAARDLSGLLDLHAGPTWRDAILHIGPAALGEVHYLDADCRYAAEPLACQLQSRGLLHQNGVRWVATMGEYLPFADRSFRVVLIPNVIDHVADPRRVLAEVRRCLAPGGHLWLSCHVSSGAINRLFRCLHRLSIGYFAGHLWFYSAATLDQTCAAAGFREVWSRTARLDLPAFVPQRSLRQHFKRRLLAARYLLLEAV